MSLRKRLTAWDRQSALFRDATPAFQMRERVDVHAIGINVLDFHAATGAPSR